MWYDVLTLNYTFIDFPLTLIWGELFMAQTKTRICCAEALVGLGDQRTNLKDGKPAQGNQGERNSDSTEIVSIN